MRRSSVMILSQPLSINFLILLWTVSFAPSDSSAITVKTVFPRCLLYSRCFTSLPVTVITPYNDREYHGSFRFTPYRQICVLRNDAVRHYVRLYYLSSVGGSYCCRKASYPATTNATFVNLCRIKNSSISANKVRSKLVPQTLHFSLRSCLCFSS